MELCICSANLSLFLNNVVLNCLSRLCKLLINKLLRNCIDWLVDCKQRRYRRVPAPLAEGRGDSVQASFLRGCSFADCESLRPVLFRLERRAKFVGFGFFCFGVVACVVCDPLCLPTEHVPTKQSRNGKGRGNEKNYAVCSNGYARLIAEWLGNVRASDG
jgi:hypothetical protein